MGNLHRVQWIDSQIRMNAYPNCRRMAKRFEISTRQASRDVEYLRYSLGAPVEYSREKNGYFYTDDTFVLPSIFIDDEEKKALSYLSRRYSQLGGSMAQRLSELFSRISGEVPEPSESVPVTLPPEEAVVYEAVSEAVRGKRKISLVYVDSRNEETERIFHPYRIFTRYMTNYAVGYCELRKGFRVFRLERVKDVRRTNETFEVSNDFDMSRYEEPGTIVERAPYEAVVRFEYRPDISLENERIGENTYRIEFQSSEDLFSALLSKRNGFSVISPRWLKDKLRRHLEKLIGMNE